jgi:hypothetical protein
MFGSITLGTDNKEQERVGGELRRRDAGSPRRSRQHSTGTLEKAEWVIVIPSMTKVALGVGGS